MKSVAVLLAGAALAAGATAATVSFSFTNPLQTTEISQTGNLGLFDTNLGTLTGVSLSFIGANQTTFTLFNTAAQAQNVEAIGTTRLNFSSSLGVLNTAIVANNPIVTLTTSTGSVSVPSGGSTAIGPVANSDTIVWTDGVGDKLNGLLGSFAAAGGGSFILGCTSLSGLNVVGGGGNILAGQRTEAACSGEIVYSFDTTPPVDVPEPGALALVGIALAGLSLTRRKTAKA